MSSLSPMERKMQRVIWGLTVNVSAVAMLAGEAEARRSAVFIPLPGSPTGNLFWMGIGVVAIGGVIFKRVMKRISQAPEQALPATGNPMAQAVESPSAVRRASSIPTRSPASESRPARAGFGRRG